MDLDRYPNLDGSVKTRAAMVSSMDTNIGRVVEALNSTGQLDDFVMVFTAVCCADRVCFLSAALTPKCTSRIMVLRGRTLSAWETILQ